MNNIMNNILIIRINRLVERNVYRFCKYLKRRKYAMILKTNISFDSSMWINLYSSVEEKIVQRSCFY